MADIAISAPRTARRAWITLAILLLLGLTFAAVGTVRIERTELRLATDDGRLLLTDTGRPLLVGHRCRLLMGPYTVPLPWSC